MARTQLPITKYPSHDGDQIAFTAADQANGMQWKNTGFEYLVIKTGATPVVVTIKGQLDNNRRLQDETIEVAANNVGSSNLWPSQLFNTAAECLIDIDDDTDVQIAVVSIAV